MGNNFQALSYYATLSALAMVWDGSQESYSRFLGRIYDSIPHANFTFMTFTDEVLEILSDSVHIHQLTGV